MSQHLQHLLGFQPCVSFPMFLKLRLLYEPSATFIARIWVGPSVDNLVPQKIGLVSEKLPTDFA